MHVRYHIILEDGVECGQETLQMGPDCLRRPAKFGYVHKKGSPCMKISGHVIGLLKEYMHDLVEQAGQEAQMQASFGFAQAPYRPDQAISDLLAILDDRIESEGMQVGLPEGFLHTMWTLESRHTPTDLSGADRLSRSGAREVGMIHVERIR